MDASVCGEFWVEGCGHGSSLPDCDYVFALGGDYFNGWSSALDPGGADENHF